MSDTAWRMLAAFSGAFTGALVVVTIMYFVVRRQIDKAIRRKGDKS